MQHAFEAEDRSITTAGTQKLYMDGVDADKIRVIMKDSGPGIPELDKAMKPGWSTASTQARELGFGAGMGLPNIKKWSDNLVVETEVGVGTTLTMEFNLT